MARTRKPKPPEPDRLLKAPTGIRGLDQITRGGLPVGRPTLVCGGPGCGKSLMSMEFLVRGATEFGEPGLFISFEESDTDLRANFGSLFPELPDLLNRGQLGIEFFRISRAEFEETGEYDLEGLFIQLALAIDAIGARRIALDTIETLFSGLPNEAIVRAELVRLFRWLKDRNLTTVITGERGAGTLTRHGLEEYVSDCVLLLDHRIEEQISTRRLRIVKYRGSAHGTNEYPFIIDDHGLSVLPVTSLGLAHKVSSERVPTGIERLDDMLVGGFYRGSSILVAGTAGTGKSSIAATFAGAACNRGERCLYFAFEESADQIVRNMLSIGLDLRPCIKSGHLQIHATRPTLLGIEQHLVSIHRSIDDLRPSTVVIDPISNMIQAGSLHQANAMLLRLVDHMKSLGITIMFTSLTHGDQALESTMIQISSLMDTWILLRDIELGGERNRGLYVIKSRGMAHSNQIREFIMTESGIELLDPYLGPEGVLTGSARLSQEAREEAQRLAHRHQIERQRRRLERLERVAEAKLAVQRELIASKKDEISRIIEQAEASERSLRRDAEAMARSRKAATKSPKKA